MRYWNKRGVKKARYWPSSFSAFLWTETQSRSHKISPQKLLLLKKRLPFPLIALVRVERLKKSDLFVYFFRRFFLKQWLAFGRCCNLKQPDEFWCQILVFFTSVLTAPRFSIFLNFDDNLCLEGFEDHVVIFSLLSFFSFPFSPLHTTQTSKAVLSTVMFICRRCQSILHCRRLNRPWYWICPRNQWRLEASTNPAMRDFCREPFRINIESFQALCRILSIFMFSFRSSSLPMENYVASGLLRLSNVSSCCSCCLPDAMFRSLCTYFSYVKQHSPHTPRWLTRFTTRTMHGTGKRPLTWV